MATKSERTRRRILDAAAKVFSERGYAGTRLSDIADEAQTKAGSLYYHFDSKDDLVEEVLSVSIDEAFAYTRASVDALGPDATPGVRLRAAIAAHAEATLKATDYTAAHVRIIGQVPDEIRRRNFRHPRKYGDYWASLFEAAIESGDIRDDLDPLVLRFLVVGALNWTVEWPKALQRSPAKIADTLNRALFEGLRRETDG